MTKKTINLETANVKADKVEINHAKETCYFFPSGKKIKAKTLKDAIKKLNKKTSPIIKKSFKNTDG